MKGKIVVQSQPHGSTIIYVLFIMLIAMILTSTITSIMLRNLQATSGYSQSARAYYAAESGVERGLYYVQWARNQKTLGAEATAATLEDITDTFSWNAAYDLNANIPSEPYSTNIAQYETGQWDIFGEDYTPTYRLLPLTDLSTIAINWNESDSCTAGASQIEVAFSSWTQFQWEDISDPDTIITRYTVSCPGASSHFECEGYLLGVDSSHLYKVRVKPLNCDLEDVTVTPQDSTGAALTTYNALTLTSTGNFAQAQRQVTATTLWRPPLQQYFDFVIFSEDRIIK